MMSLIAEMLAEEFMLRALLATIILSFVSPVIGIFLVARNMSLMGDAISHAILPGIAISFLLYGMSMIAMLLGGVVAGIIVAFLARLISKIAIIKEDASFASFYLISLSLGILIISISGTKIDLISILFGSILAVGKQELYILATIASLSLLVFAIIIRGLMIEVIDPNISKEQSKKHYLHIINFIFLFLVVLNMVAGFQILGSILLIGLMIIPAISAKMLTKSLNWMLIISIIFSICSSIIGLFVSYAFDLPTGPAIIIMTGILYIIVFLYVWINQLIIRPHFTYL